MPEIITTQPDWTTAPDAATYKTDLDTAILELDVVAATRAAVARAIGGTAYQTLLGLPCPPSLEWVAYDSVELPSGYPSWMTFTRASSATRVGPTGLIESVASGVLRHDYDPETLEYKGVMIERPCTNSLRYSQDLTNAAWNKNRTTITADAAVAPDGTTTMDKVVEDSTAANTHLFQQSVSIVSGEQLTFSRFYKKDERNQIRMRFNGTPFPSFPTALFDLDTGTVVSSSNVDKAGVINYGDGIYRCYIVATAVDTASAWLQCYISVNGRTTYDGDGTSGLFAWGAQLEAGVSPTSYIPTTSAAATRAADVLSVATSDFAYNQSEGTLYVEFGVIGLPPSGNNALVVGPWKDANNRHGFFVNSGGNINTFNRILASTDVSIFNGIPSDLTRVKTAYAYKDNDFASVNNGGTVGTDTSCTVATGITKIDIGGLNGVNVFLSCHIRHIAYFPRRITNTQLQHLTS